MRDLQQCLSNPPSISQTKVSFGCAFDHQVFSEAAGSEMIRGFWKILRPLGIVRRAIGMDCLVGAAVVAKIRLFVTH